MDDPLLYTSANTMTGPDVQEVLNENQNYFQWNKKELVLDVGAGPGTLTATVLLPFLPEDSVLVAGDISEEMIKHGNSFYGSSRIMFKKLDIEGKNIDPSWKLESFDKIFSFYCLHRIRDQRQAVRNIYSLLKPNGEILLMFLTPTCPMNLVSEKMKSFPKWNKFMKGIIWFYETDDPTSFHEGILSESGLRNIKCYLKKSIHRFSSSKALMDLVQAVNPYLSQIPADLKSAYLEEYEDLFKQEKCIRYDETNGEVTMEYDLLIALARKP